MRHLTAALLIAITTACGNNTTPEPETAIAPAPDDAAIAQQADLTLMNALQAGNAETAGSLLDADFEWTDAQGRTRGRQDALGALSSLGAEFQNEEDAQTYHYGRAHVITSEREGARMMRVWALRPDGWRLFAAISTALATGTTPFAAAGAPANADCENPCRTVPFEPVTDTTKEIARIFQQLKMDEWHPNPENWARRTAANSATRVAVQRGRRRSSM